jgi:hypothetical protein
MKSICTRALIGMLISCAGLLLPSVGLATTGYVVHDLPGLPVATSPLFGRPGILHNPADDTVSRSLAADAATLSVYRFRNLKNGYYLLSADPAERANINANLLGTWLEEGLAYTVNPATPESTRWTNSARTGRWQSRATAGPTSGLANAMTGPRAAGCRGKPWRATPSHLEVEPM